MAAKKPVLKKKPVAKKKPKVYKGKSTAPGGGGSFQMEVDAMVKKGMDPKMAAAIAAKNGRAKVGQKTMTKWSVAGRKRSAKKRVKK